MRWTRRLFLALWLCCSVGLSFSQSSSPALGLDSLPPWPSLEPVLSSVLDWSALPGSGPYALKTLEALESYSTAQSQALDAIVSERKSLTITSDERLRQLEKIRVEFKRLSLSSKLGWGTATVLATFLLARTILD